MKYFEKIFRKLFDKTLNNNGTSKIDEGWKAFHEANRLADLKKDNKALEFYDTAIKCDIIEAFEERAFCLQSLGFNLKAIMDFDEATNYYPDDANLFFGRGMSKMILMRNDEALENFKIAVGLAKIPNEKYKWRDVQMQEKGWGLVVIFISRMKMNVQEESNLIMIYQL